MTQVFVGIGSNIEPEAHVREALTALELEFGGLEISPIYRCPAVGFSGADFVNLVVGFATTLAIEMVQQRLRTIEAACGRHRAKRDGARTMDLDMLIYGDAVFDNGDVRVPRADILDYAFVLRPLAELRPQGRHPVLERSYAELWSEFDAHDQPLTRIELY